MPTLMPFSVSAYHGTEQTRIVLYMQILQNCGDVIGRLATAGIYVGQSGLVVCSVIVFGIFGFFFFIAVESHLVPEAIPGAVVVQIVLPALFGIYYFVRGLSVTTAYLHARTFATPDEAAKLSVNMGFAGQMGAMSTAAITFVLANPLHVFGH